MHTQIRNFNEWASAVYENKTFKEEPNTYFFDKGDADPRSLFECLLSSIDSSVNEALETMDFDFNEVDKCLVEGIVDSVKAGNDEPINEVFKFVKKSIDLLLLCYSRQCSIGSINTRY
jgi:hypothetical protein